MGKRPEKSAFRRRTRTCSHLGFPAREGKRNSAAGKDEWVKNEGFKLRHRTSTTAGRKEESGVTFLRRRPSDRQTKGPTCPQAGGSNECFHSFSALSRSFGRRTLLRAADTEEWPRFWEDDSSPASLFIILTAQQKSTICHVRLEENQQMMKVIYFNTIDHF